MRVLYHRNILQILIDATSPHSTRYWRDSSLLSSPRIAETALAASINRIMSSFPEFLKTSSSREDFLYFWDPFCTDGCLLLEALTFFFGIPPGSPRLPYPFYNFPLHSPSLFASVLDSLDITPYDMAKKVSFIGTTHRNEDTEMCKMAWNTFLERRPLKHISDATLLSQLFAALHFHQSSPEDVWVEENSSFSL
ncbi:Rna methylase family UPF0020 protein [Cardiosporidium cionae]|uniref:Rna methylase family UPF0020 protein n=1 Tax=Cardiosporidium cionae TaxID=476202 RepID=A0ABQ7JG46_9APIC|nr:Rna methylase family UPF0020 protein [Cardiosporidium cionae]|eukprot:KAF8822998.1 Rna methylase family UPF0020 protein [Cardiosporidium cionae]